METLGDRLKKIRKNKNLTQSMFGESLGLTKQAAANVETGHSNPSIDFLGKLIENFDVNGSRLITGRGLMFNQPAAFTSENSCELTLKIEEVLRQKGLI